MTHIDAVMDVNNRRVLLIAEMTSNSVRRSNNFIIYSKVIKWFEYILSHAAYNFTCKTVLHRMVVQFKSRRFEQDVRVVLKYLGTNPENIFNLDLLHRRK